MAAPAEDMTNASEKPPACSGQYQSFKLRAQSSGEWS